jgi:hypothetical protein
MKTSPLPFLLLLALWGVAGVAAGLVHLLAHLPPLAIPLLVGGLTLALTLASAQLVWVRGPVAGFGTRQILVVNVLRLIGFYFLWLNVQGRLPAEFAHRAGWGDVAVAAAALALLFLPDGPFFQRALRVWNLLGLADLLLAVGTGGWLNLTRPGSMIEMSGLPLTLVPLWLVPIYLFGHLVIYRRLGKSCTDRAALAAV